MRGEIAHLAEVVDGGHDAAAKEMMPGAVDEHSGRERVVRGHEAVGEFTAATFVRDERPRVDRLQKPSRHWIRRLLVVAADIERLVEHRALDDARCPHGGREARVECAVAGDLFRDVGNPGHIGGQCVDVEQRVEQSDFAVRRGAVAPGGDRWPDCPLVEGGQGNAVRRSDVRDVSTVGRQNVEERRGGQSDRRWLTVARIDGDDAEPRPRAIDLFHGQVAGRRDLQMGLFAPPVFCGECDPQWHALFERRGRIEQPLVAGKVSHHQPHPGLPLAGHEQSDRVVLDDESRRVQDGAVARDQQIRVDAGR